MANETQRSVHPPSESGGRLGALEWKRGGLLFVAFFICIFAILFTRPLRSALLLEYHSPEMLPRLWILTGGIMFVWIFVYNRLLRAFAPERIFVGSIAFCGLALFAINLGFPSLPGLSSQALYVWNDVASIIIIEQIWALLDDYFNEEQAKRAFGPIGFGGIAGGIGGAWLSGRLIDHYRTLELIDFSVWIMVVLLVPALFLAFSVNPREGGHRERAFDVRRVQFRRGFELIRTSRFLQLLALSVLLVQMTSNIVDLQFNSYVNATFQATDDRSRYLARFLMWMNTFSALLMLGLPVWLLRRFGVRTGLLILPVVNGSAAVASLFGVDRAYPAAKFVDKSFNYSIQRASKEILYIPIRAEDRFQLKPILDVFLYRMSETVAAAAVIPFLKYFDWRWLGGLTSFICVLQMIVVFAIFRARRQIPAETLTRTG
jgi:AAA family ATP:ADP antiporter